MTENSATKREDRDKAMRSARDEILGRVGTWLIGAGFSKEATGHFSRSACDATCHIGFQKHSSGRNIRILCHIDKNGSVAVGPTSDAYERPNSPNKIKYHFGWSTREADIAKCAEEYCRYITDVALAWFREQAPPK